MTTRLTLLTSLVSLALWIATTFIWPVGLGIVHAFLAIAVIAWIRWWALRVGAGS